MRKLAFRLVKTNFVKNWFSQSWLSEDHFEQFFWKSTKKERILIQLWKKCLTLEGVKSFFNIEQKNLGWCSRNWFLRVPRDILQDTIWKKNNSICFLVFVKTAFNESGEHFEQTFSDFHFSDCFLKRLVFHWGVFGADLLEKRNEHFFEKKIEQKISKKQNDKIVKRRIRFRYLSTT